MAGFSNHRRSLEGGALALLVVLALHTPPLQLVARIDLELFDAWTRWSPATPSSDIVVVDVEDAATLETVAKLAQHEAARLVVTTWPEPPSAAFDGLVVGPVDVPIDELRLRRTEWRHGGHLAFATDLDGRVRRDRSLTEAGALTPSLAAYAAHTLAPTSHALHDDNTARWPRFFPGQPFSTLSAEELQARHVDLRDRVVIAGPFGETHATPVGTLSTPELLAHVVASYVDNRRIDAGMLGSLAAWSVGALLVLLVTLRAPSTRRGVALAAGGAGAALLFWAWSSFAFGGLWVPVAGPAAWLALTGVALAWQRRGRVSTPAQETDLAAARKAVADGDLARAWSLYRQVSPASTLVPELYELACALETGGAEREAADLFHRIAQIDGAFRDVAKRLVRCGQPNTASTPIDAANMPPSMGRYEILEPIARGATGYVYLGRDPKINRIVALKVIDLAAEFEPEDLAAASGNFLREAEIAGRLSHPNIVTIFDVGESTGLAYIAMEYLKGKHLSEFATPDRLLPVGTVLDLLSKTADALDYAHAQNVVHRDIKPANIMYDSISDGLKITDFGIARLIDVGRTRTGIVLGTPAFMSPEQLEGKNVNGHTDLFALGVSLYQLLTGQLPFRGASMTKLMFVIANEPHESVTTVRPDLPACLDPIVDRALAKNPADRFQSGAEMAAALRYGAAQLA
jgi:eukaryotic-like serine/threonine-protein kinase